MRLSDLLRMGCVNLWRRKTRTLLTALSMTIGVMCIVVLISIGIGYERAYRESLEAMGSLTKIDVTPTATARSKIALLNDKAVTAFAALDGVEAVTPVVQSSAYLKSGKYVNMVRLYGIDLSVADSFLLTPERGAMPTAGIRMKPEVMVSADVGSSFADPNDNWKEAVGSDGAPLIDPLHSNIRLTFDYSNLSGEQREGEDGRAVPAGASYQLRVLGICPTLNNTFTSALFLDSKRLEEWMDANQSFTGSNRAEGDMTREERIAKARAEAGGKTYNLVWIKVKDAADVQRIAGIIQDAGFSTYSLNDMLEAVRTQSRQIQGLLGAIGAIAMIVSAFGVANTMMMSITERTREVGILKVLGTELGDISKMFLAEAAIVGVLGGISGLLLSFLVQLLLPTLLAGMDLHSIIPPWLAMGGILFAGAVALLSALLPAIKAMRISPNAAIRTE